MPIGKEKQLDKEELEKLIREREAQFVAEGKSPVLYASDPGRTILKPGEYNKTRRRQKDNYQQWLDEISAEKDQSGQG